MYFLGLFVKHLKVGFVVFLQFEKIWKWNLCKRVIKDLRDSKKTYFELFYLINFCLFPSHNLFFRFGFLFLNDFQQSWIIYVQWNIVHFEFNLKQPG